MQLILVTGLSGSGKSVALNVLADSGYYCVDNLPATLVPELTRFLEEAGHARAALAIDVRSGTTLGALPHLIAGLRQRGIDLKMLYLEAKTDALVQRFSETRRRHPLSDGRLSLPECIERERELLAELGALAHHVDTSDLSPNVLCSWVKDFVEIPDAGLILMFESFAFKHGIPLDADFVFDARCLPNPHYDPQLRPLTGNDAAVVDFLSADGSVQRMYQDIQRFIANWLPCFQRDNRSYLTVAIGCTGGRHRSVFLAERLARHFATHTRVLVRHRELA